MAGDSWWILLISLKYCTMSKQKIAFEPIAIVKEIFTKQKLTWNALEWNYACNKT